MTQARSKMESVSDERRRQILAMRPEDRGALASLIRRERDKIPGEIARLQDEQERLTQWLAEFAPELADQPGTPRTVSTAATP